MSLPRDEIVWQWNTTELTCGQLARKYGTTKGVILGIIHRDPRAKQRRPQTAAQKTRRYITALEAEVRRLQALEAALAQSKRMERKAAA
jgi:hypothetical protein